jgi:hypothetical protein
MYLRGTVTRYRLRTAHAREEVRVVRLCSKACHVVGVRVDNWPRGTYNSPSHQELASSSAHRLLPRHVRNPYLNGREADTHQTYENGDKQCQNSDAQRVCIRALPSEPLLPFACWGSLSQQVAQRHQPFSPILVLSIFVRFGNSLVSVPAVNLALGIKITPLD